MNFTNLFQSGKHKRNLGHFAAIVKVAAADGKIIHEEEKLLIRLASKLNISEGEYEQILKNPTAYPLTPSFTAEGRLERLHDLFMIIFADHKIDDRERFLIEKYAIGLGYPEKEATRIIDKSIAIFSGNINFEEYKYLINKKQD